MAASVPTALVPIAIPPGPTDFHYCHPRFGENLDGSQCVRAVSALLRSASVTEYSLQNTYSPFHLPFSISYGDCRVSVDVAGPRKPEVIRVRPDYIRGMAGWVLQACVLRAHLGGYVTFGFGHITDFFLNPTSDITASYPNSMHFLTVSITGPQGKPKSPGDYDPSIPGTLSRYLSVRVTAADRPNKQRYSLLSQMMEDVATSMAVHDMTKTWWQINAIPPSQMTYTCDSKLGSPTLVDCAHLRYQLGATSDSIQLGPGTVSFVSSSTCHLAISATIAITLTWAQIQATLDALTNTCVGHPLKASTGGRAYYGLHPAQIKGRKWKRKITISALSALPDHVNLTVFQQFEPWQTAAAAEMKSCTWKAVMEEKDVRSCVTA